MSIFNSISRAFKGPKEPTAAQIKMLLAKAEVEVAEASTAVEAIAARLPSAVMAGEDGVAAHREETRKAAEKLSYLRQAQAVLADKLASAQEQEAEDARRAAYGKADTAQRAAQVELVAKYPVAVAELIRLRELVAEADRLREVANLDLPQGASPLLETEAIRDVQAAPARIVSEELVDAWFMTEGDTPVDAGRVTRQQGRRGVIYAESAFVPCELRRVRKVTRAPWCPPVYGSRLADLELPDLKAEPGTPPKPVTEFVPLEVVDAAE
ncbi:hypothetical protein [Xanthobacter sp. 126]|uniref:hypothetical protein n=1 Tax=Xanthobacter sp. 126 TaxID=1131814 RepID=UPI00045E8E80|nr:hypothetical protein [Xanthobacter sp. 126]